MSHHASIVASATISVNTIEDLTSESSRQELRGKLQEFHFARIHGLVTPAAVDRAMQLMRSSFDCEKDRATTGESPSEVRKTFQKLSIGRARHGGVNRARFMRCFYLPMWEPDEYQLRNIFRTVAQVRNLLGNRRMDFAIDEEEEGMWTASRVHHFPAGGGFMVGHRDTVLPQIYREGGIGDFFQPLILLSQKGRDFYSGGGFIELQGERVSYEDYCERGDIVIYDTSTVHGVEDVDPNIPFRQNQLHGRMSGLVTLFQNRGDAS